MTVSYGQIRTHKTFSDDGCKGCGYRAGNYCWWQCPYNMWHQGQPTRD